MITSDCVNVSKKNIINKLVILEAENVALKRKINIYEDIIKTHVQKHQLHADVLHDIDKEPENITEISTYPAEYRNDAEKLFIKKKIINFLREPEKNSYLIHPLINQLVAHKKYNNITPTHIKEFLNN